MSKFSIRFDKESQLYWTLANEVIDRLNPWQRNLLILASSPDLIHWTREKVLLYEPEHDVQSKRSSKNIFLLNIISIK